MSAPIIPKSTHASDLQFLRHLRIANRQQLRAMLAVFQQLVPDGAPECGISWKRAAVERKLGVNRSAFPWLEREEWWNEATEEVSP